MKIFFYKYILKIILANESLFLLEGLACLWRWSFYKAISAAAISELCKLKQEPDSATSVVFPAQNQK